MSTVSQFPTPDLGGPQYSFFKPEVPDWDEVTSEERFDDGGIATYLDADDPIRTWILRYTVLDQLNAKILDDHREEAKGKNNDFSFRDPRSGVLYIGVRYVLYEYPDHQKVNSQSRNIVLGQYP